MSTQKKTERINRMLSRLEERKTQLTAFLAENPDHKGKQNRLERINEKIASLTQELSE